MHAATEPKWLQINCWTRATFGHTTVDKNWTTTERSHSKVTETRRGCALTVFPDVRRCIDGYRNVLRAQNNNSGVNWMSCFLVKLNKIRAKGDIVWETPNFMSVQSIRNSISSPSPTRASNYDKWLQSGIMLFNKSDMYRACSSVSKVVTGTFPHWFSEDKGDRRQAVSVGQKNTEWSMTETSQKTGDFCSI